MNKFKTWIHLVTTVSVFATQLPQGAHGAEGCFDKKWKQPEGQVATKLDLLFVADTSASLNPKRVELANGIGAFITQLPKTIDYQVAVTLAHSSKTIYSGKLFQRYQEPVVLRSSELTLAQIKNNLIYKLNASILDGWADGGELAMFAALELLKPDKLAVARTKNKFFRSDAVLVVVFISDENDICATYPKGVTPVYDGDHLEANSKKLFCNGVTPEAVIKRVREVQGGMPSLFGAVVYNNKNKVPKSGEDEYGYGFMELIEMSNGISVDIADAHYTEGLAKIGQLANTQMALYHDFSLPEGRIYPNSVRAKVDGIDVESLFRPETNSVYIENSGKPLSDIVINYCTMGDEAEGSDSNPSNSPDTSCGLPDCNIIGI